MAWKLDSEKQITDLHFTTETVNVDLFTKNNIRYYAAYYYSDSSTTSYRRLYINIHRVVGETDTSVATVYKVVSSTGSSSGTYTDADFGLTFTFKVYMVSTVTSRSEYIGKIGYIGPKEVIAKVQIGDETIMDVTNTTATQDKVSQGYYFYGADGVRKVGTNTSANAYEYFVGGSYTAGDYANITEAYMGGSPGSNFKSKTALQKITFHKPVTFTTGTSATGSFYGCTGLTDFICTDTVAFNSATTSTGTNGTFGGCVNLRNVSIPNVTSLGNYTFSGCTGLTSTGLATNTTLTSLGNYTFSGCTGLTSTGLATNTTLTTLGGGAFYGCTGLTSTGLATNTTLTTLGGSVFSGCTGLTSTGLATNTTLTTLGDSVFYGCTGLTSEDISNVDNISPSGLFYECDNLTSIIVKNGVTLSVSGYVTQLKDYAQKFASFNNHLYWWKYYESGSNSYAQFYKSDATTGTPSTTLIGQLKYSTTGSSFTHTDGDYSLLFRVSAYGKVTITWT